jgi:tRNA(Ile)-lysidine synthase
MPRSHSPSLLRQVRTTLQKECTIKKGDSMFVAVSGGPDSMSLLHGLSLLRDDMGFRLTALSINHGLRPEAVQEVQLVGDFCGQLRVPFRSATLTLNSGSNVQERARQARYQTLWTLVEKHCPNEGLLCTAHQKEDRAETVLMRILRGTSLEGLAVLPPRADRLLRPMIRASRGDVSAYVERHRIPTCQDPSNGDHRYFRVQIRERLLPLLEDLGPGSIDHLVELAEEAALLGEPLGLNREQRSQMRRALRDPALNLRLRLPGGLLLTREVREKTAK